MFDLDAIDRIDWASLRGAYGPSVGAHDVAAALRTLATDLDSDSDSRNDALDCVLWSHAWHQGSIYEVSAAVVPFLCALVDAGCDVGDDAPIAGGLESFLRSAVHREPEPHGAAVLAAFARCAPQILAWRARAKRLAALVGAFVPGARDAWLELIDNRPAAVDWLALAALRDPPAWAYARARKKLKPIGAALLVLRHGSLADDPELADDLQDVLRVRLDDDDRDELAMFGLAVPEMAGPRAPRLSFSGARVPGRVVFVGPHLVLVRVGDANVSFAVSDTGATRGDAVRVGLVGGRGAMLEVAGRQFYVP